MILRLRAILWAVHSESAVPPQLAPDGRAVDAFDVYLNKRGPYVGGKSVRADELPAIVRKSRKRTVVLTAEPDLPRERVKEITALIRKGGAEKVRLAAPKPQPDGRLVAIERALEKDGPLEVYLNKRGAYICGKSVRGEDLPWVVRKIGKGDAILTPEPDIPLGKVEEVTTLIREGGVQKVKLGVPPLRTTVQILQNELTKKESMIAEMLQHDGGSAKMPRHQQKLMQKKVDSFLCNSLRKNIKDLKLQMDAKDEEIIALKKNMKSTKIHELEVRLRPN